MPVDFEVLVTKILGYFHIYTVRVKRLNDFCDFVGQEYKQILGYANVRWLSLLSAFERILKIYPSLMSCLMSETQCTKVQKQFFENGETELCLSFVHSQASLFHETKWLKVITSAQQNQPSCENSVVKTTNTTRWTFYPAYGEVTNWSSTGCWNDNEKIFQNIKRTYDTALSYLEAWNKHNEDLPKLSCRLLDKVPTRGQFWQC
jgi:hypothetical protein